MTRYVVISESSDSVDGTDSLKSCPSVSPQIASGENIKMNLGDFDYKSLQKYQILQAPTLATCVPHSLIYSDSFD